MKEYYEPIKADLEVENVNELQKVEALFDNPDFKFLYDTYCSLRIIEEKTATKQFKTAYEELNRLSDTSYDLDTFYQIGKAANRSGDTLKVELIDGEGKTVFKNFNISSGS